MLGKPERNNKVALFYVVFRLKVDILLTFVKVREQTAMEALKLLNRAYILNPLVLQIIRIYFELINLLLFV